MFKPFILYLKDYENRVETHTFIIETKLIFTFIFDKKHKCK